MATRIQNKILGVSLDDQTTIKLPAANFMRLRQLNAELAPSGFLTENDAAEIGKGNEFISSTGVYPVSFNPLARIEKYASAEFMTWAWAFAMGKAVETAGVYAITPIDVCVDGMELPYFTVVEQVCEGGGQALDNAYIGCAIEDVEYTFNYGPGRQSGKCVVNWVGSGIMHTPSTIVLPAVTAEHYLLSGSMSMVINGTDYITAATMLSGTIAWKNNLLVGPGFFPGSGMQDGAATRGRIEIGPRAATFTFTARLLKNSDEYAKLLNPALGDGTATVTATFDATHGVTFNFPSIQYETVVNGETDGIVSVTVTVAVKFDSTAGYPMSVDASCGITGIAQMVGAKTNGKSNGKSNGKTAPPPPIPPPAGGNPPAQHAGA